MSLSLGLGLDVQNETGMSGPPPVTYRILTEEGENLITETSSSYIVQEEAP